MHSANPKGKISCHPPPPKLPSVWCSHWYCLHDQQPRKCSCAGNHEPASDNNNNKMLNDEHCCKHPGVKYVPFTITYPVLDTLTATRMFLTKFAEHEMNEPTWISLGKVALNMSVCLSFGPGMLSFSTMRRICGSNPMSSIRSASSNTKNLMDIEEFSLSHNKNLIHTWQSKYYVLY